MRHLVKLVIVSFVGAAACAVAPETAEQAVEVRSAATNTVDCSQYWGCDPVCPGDRYTNTIHEICFENGGAISDTIISAHGCNEECF